MAIRIVGDELAEVTALLTRWADTKADDVTSVQMRIASGAVAQCLVSQLAPGSSCEVKLIGDKGLPPMRGGTFLQFEIEILGNEADKLSEPALRHDTIEMMPVPEPRQFSSAILEERPMATAPVLPRAVLRVAGAVNVAGPGRAAVGLQPCVALEL